MRLSLYHVLAMRVRVFTSYCVLVLRVCVPVCLCLPACVGEGGRGCVGGGGWGGTWEGESANTGGAPLTMSLALIALNGVNCESPV